MSQSGVTATTQYLQNESWDTVFGTLVFQAMLYDGQNLQRPNADNLQIKSVISGGYTYFCFAAPGTAEATAKWRIFRLDGDANLMYAGGDAGYTNVASDPTALSYSYT
jgi:hypothetical protein